MNSIPAIFEIVKVSEKEFDIIIFSDNKVLKAFQSIYENVFYIENSKFEKPILIVPSFGTKEIAEIWRDYWVKALNNPEESCKSCPTVQQFFKEIEESK